MDSLSSTKMVRPVRGGDDRLVDHPSVVAAFPDAALREQVVREARVLLLPGARVLFEEGDVAEHLYLVLHGRLQVFHRVGGGIVSEVHVGPGELCGERAMVAGGRRLGSVRALRDTLVLELDHEGFERLVAAHPAAMVVLLREIAAELIRKDRDGDRRGQVRTVAVVALQPGLVPARAARSLSAALGERGTLIHLDRETVDAALGEDASQQPFDAAGGTDLTAWLHQRENEHRFVIYEGDRELTDWTRRCVRQADRVLLLVDPRQPLQPGALAAYVDRHGDTLRDRAELILVGPGAAAPWIEASGARAWHRMDPEDAAAVHRMARRLAGAEVGLVFSGGGARCAAHLGVARALREAGVPLDHLGGTSGGAFFAGLLAQGLGPDEALRAARRQLEDGGRLFDLSVPVFGLISGQKWKQVLIALFEERRIEDLPIPFFCVSTNLSDGVSAIHDRGPLWRWIRASMSIPGLTPPLIDDGVVYVDGAVLNNLPIDVMRGRVTGPIVGSNVARNEGPRAPAGTFHVPPPWKTLLDRRGERSQLPGIIDVLLGATMVSGIRNSRQFEPVADLIVRPNVQDHAHLDFHGLEALAETGYRAAVAAFEAHGVPGR